MRRRAPRRAPRDALRWLALERPRTTRRRTLCGGGSDQTRGVAGVKRRALAYTRMAPYFRGMFADGARPALGDAATALGVRVPADVRVAPDGCVHPGAGGMSVADSVAALPSHRRPLGLLGGTGSPKLRLWFIDGAALGSSLQLRQAGRKAHHLVEPSEPMPLRVYRSAIAATRDQWQEILS